VGHDEQALARACAHGRAARSRSRQQSPQDPISSPDGNRCFIRTDCDCVASCCFRRRRCEGMAGRTCGLTRPAVPQSGNDPRTASHRHGAEGPIIRRCTSRRRNASGDLPAEAHRDGFEASRRKPGCVGRERVQVRHSQTGSGLRPAIRPRSSLF